MAVVNSDIRYRLLGQDVSAGSTFKKVAGEASSAHSAISQLGQTLNATGAFTPFQQALDSLSAGFKHIQENGKSARVVMQGVGIGVAAVGGALLGLGANAQQAHAGLQQAILDTGRTYETFAEQIDATVAKTATFGRTAGDTENALARLTTAVQDPQKALSLMGLTANIAASRNLNLTDSAQVLTSALAGNTRVFRQFGINVGQGKLSADQLNAALDELNRRLAGRAQAQADTFSGRIKGLGVEFENAAESLTKFAPLLLTVGASMTVVSGVWDALAARKARDLALNTELVVSNNRVAASEARAALSGLPDLRSPAALAALEGGGGSLLSLSRANLLRGGGIAVGGLLAGSVASAAIGGKSGSIIGDILGGAGAGAGIGTLFGPGPGTLIGAAVGGVGGALLGALHGGGNAKLSPLAKSIATQQLPAIDFSQFLNSEIDPLGNPKAAGIASATESLAKAKTRLARAQQDLNKQTSVAADPLKLEAATARLTAAQESLHRAEYSGKGVAAAQASVDSAQAAINALHAGTDTTAADRRVADARQAVADARSRVTQARSTGAVNAAGFLRLLEGNDRRANQRLAAQRHLVGEGLGQDVIQAIDRLDATHPGSLIAISQGLDRGLVKRLNLKERDYQGAATAFKDAATPAFRTAAQALGAQISRDMLRSFERHNAARGIYSPGNLGAPYQQPNGLAGLLSPGVHINSVTVQANDPNKFVKEISGKARHRALSSSSAQVPGSRLLGP